MSGECQKCYEHCLDCQCNEKDKVEIQLDDLMELIYWSRRYCDGRSTYAPSRFNKLYDKFLKFNQNISIKEKDQFDETLMHKGKYWPYAQDGMFNEDTGSFDARSK